MCNTFFSLLTSSNFTLKKISLQLASICFIVCVCNSRESSSCGLDRTCYGFFWMTPNLSKNYCCRLCASKNRSSTNSYDSIPDLSRRNVNIWSIEFILWCVISRVSHRNVLICELFICTSSSDDVWKLHRKSLNYSFNVKILQSFIPIFIENAQKLCADLSENLDKKQQFDMLTYTSHSALNMICGEWTKCWLTSLACWCRKRKRRKMIKR